MPWLYLKELEDHESIRGIVCPNPGWRQSDCDRSRLRFLAQSLRREIRSRDEPKVREAKCLTKDRADLPALYDLPAEPY